VLVLGKFTALSRLIIRSLELQRGVAGRLDNGLARSIDGGAECARPQLAIVIESDAAAAETAVRALKQRWPDVRVLVYGAADEEDAVLNFLAAGADGLVASDEPLEQLAQAVRDVLSNGFHLPPHLVRPLFDRLIRLDPKSRQRGRPRVTGLSAREIEVLAHVARSESNKEIALGLHVEEQTVKNHMRDILRKLGVHSRADAARAAPWYVKDGHAQSPSHE
jgi:DNA-binding NarL/FixJ family response regulator